MSLPNCIHRGPDMGSGEFTCASNRIMHFAGFAVAATCLQCPYADLPNTIDDGPPPPTLRQRPCIFLGPVSNKFFPDGSTCNCPAKWLRACEIHGECTAGLSGRAGIPNCHTCGDYDPDAI